MLRRRRLVVAAAAVGVVVAALGGISVVGAATTPGNVPFKAKWADWMRAHDGAFLVNPMERWYYSAAAPDPGGRPGVLNAVPAVPAPATAAHKGTAAPVPAQGDLAPPTPVPLVVSPALPGEGGWTPTGPLVHGRAGMYVAQFRADTTYTAEITTAVWLDPARLRLRLVPGSQEPGGSWPAPPYLGGAALDHAVAAFNGGFRMQDAGGGFYLGGRTAQPLRNGAASVVIYKDGRATVGSWGTDVNLSGDVEAVRQNLVLLVDHGQVAPAATHSDNSIWGDTLGAATVVARSGIGVTSAGAIVYVAGPALTVRTLAEALARAGCVRAMTLDLNPEWVTFNLYQHPDPANPGQVRAAKLYPQMKRPATRYIGPAPEARDFFTVSTPGI